MLEHGSLTRERRNWSEAARAIDASTRTRIRQVEDTLGLPPGLRGAFRHAVMEAARLHAADMMLAQHEAHSGHGWPAEDREAHEALHQVHWEQALETLRAASRHVARP